MATARRRRPSDRLFVAWRPRARGAAGVRPLRPSGRPSLLNCGPRPTAPRPTGPLPTAPPYGPYPAPYRTPAARARGPGVGQGVTRARGTGPGRDRGGVGTGMTGGP